MLEVLHGCIVAVLAAQTLGVLEHGRVDVGGVLLALRVQGAGEVSRLPYLVIVRSALVVLEAEAHVAVLLAYVHEPVADKAALVGEGLEQARVAEVEVVLQVVGHVGFAVHVHAVLLGEARVDESHARGADAGALLVLLDEEHLVARGLDFLGGCGEAHVAGRAGTDDEHVDVHRLDDVGLGDGVGLRAPVGAAALGRLGGVGKRCPGERAGYGCSGQARAGSLHEATAAHNAVGEVKRLVDLVVQTGLIANIHLGPPFFDKPALQTFSPLPGGRYDGRTARLPCTSAGFIIRVLTQLIMRGRHCVWGRHGGGHSQSEGRRVSGCRALWEYLPSR